jgi:hypothetical protein
MGKARFGRRRLVGMMSAAAGLTLLLAASAGAQSPGTPPVPIGSTPTTAPAFIGKAAKPNPIARGFAIPRDPFLAPNNRSNLHVDAYQ